MPSNNTENILSTPFTEGTGNPIPASRISYDGTGTSIEATTVQGAITEVDTDLQSTKDDVDALKTELRDNYVISGYGTVVVNADGTKDFDTLLDDLKTEITAVLANIEDDELLVPKNLYIKSFYSLVADYTQGWAKGTTNFTPSFSRAGGSVTKGIIARAVLATTNEMYNWSIETTGNTVKNWLADVPSSEQTLTFSYQKIKKV